MKNRINIAELLKDCPTGMELDCTMFDNVSFIGLQESSFPIIIHTSDGCKFLTPFGCYHDSCSAKCVIFPKGKTTWEGFHRPFEPGDIVIHGNNENAFIYSGENDKYWECYCGVFCGTRNICINSKSWSDKRNLCRLATEKEKARLFQAIKDNGYKWNAETKVLERLTQPKFHKGDWIVFNGLVLYVKEVVNGFYRTISKGGIANSYDWDIDNVARLWTIQDARDGDVLFHSDSASSGIFIFKEILQRGTIQKVICHCDYDYEDGFCLGENHTCCWADSKILHPATKGHHDLLFQKMKGAGYKWNIETKILEKLAKPKFKVGDRIKKNKDYISGIITNISNDGDYKVEYQGGGVSYVSLAYQDEWELIPNKFDINTLIPFESRVLVRDYSHEIWRVSFWGCLINSEHGFKYDTIRGPYKQCIPYEGNEHLLGKMEDCADFYKTW